MYNLCFISSVYAVWCIYMIDLRKEIIRKKISNLKIHLPIHYKRNNRKIMPSLIMSFNLYYRDEKSKIFGKKTLH